MGTRKCGRDGLGGGGRGENLRACRGSATCAMHSGRHSKAFGRQHVACTACLQGRQESQRQGWRVDAREWHASGWRVTPSAAVAARRQGNTTLVLRHASARECRAEQERERGSASPRAAAGDTKMCNLSLPDVPTVTPLPPDKKPPYCNICHRRAISGARLCPHYFVKRRVGKQARRHANSSVKLAKPRLVLCKRHQAMADALAE